MRRAELEALVAEMSSHEANFKDIRRAKYAGNFRRDPSLKRFIPIHHIMFLDYKDKLDNILHHMNSRNHSKKQLQLLLAKANALDNQWDIELRQYFN